MKKKIWKNLMIIEVTVSIYNIPMSRLKKSRSTVVTTVIWSRLRTVYCNRATSITNHSKVRKCIMRKTGGKCDRTLFCHFRRFEYFATILRCIFFEFLSIWSVKILVKKHNRTPLTIQSNIWKILSQSMHKFNLFTTVAILHPGIPLCPPY